MTLLARISAAAVLMSCLIAVSGAQSGSSDAPPEQITTDTLAYCRELAARLERLTGTAALIPASVVRLSSAGKDMCDRGLTRGGILRLRKAIVLMMHPEIEGAGETAPSR